MIRLAAGAFGLWLVATCSAVAGATGEAANDSVEAVNAARAAAIEALSNAPLGFRRILFVSAIPDGFAVYQPRDNASFAPDEPLIVYTEPIGVAWTQDGDQFSSKLVIDFEIRTPDGKVLGGQKEFGEFAFTAREPPIDYMAHVTVNLTGAAPGAYILGLTLRDTNSGKVASADLPFEIK